MQIFIDTADLEQIRTAAQMGIVDGVTTNPTLVARTGRSIEELVPLIAELIDGPISAEVLATEADAMVQEARRLASLHRNVVVKIPLTAEGLRAVRTLHAEGIKTNVTLCFSAPQALLAAKAGATYVSPFVGRLDDIGEAGMGLVEQVLCIYRNYGFETQVLVASVRHPRHVVRAAELGADVATVPFATLMKLVQHPMTDLGLERFLRDAGVLPKQGS